MISQNNLIHVSDSWQQQLRNTLTTADQLLHRLDLTAQDVGFSARASAEFSLKVPLAFVNRMRPGDPRDPLLLQVLASAQELQQTPGYDGDPVGETGASNPQRGIIHKYHGRALLIVSGGCAVNCRYCFRRHFPYSDNQNSREQWREALLYVRADSSIEEVILSGGDPLVATDGQLAELVAEIASIEHVRRLRIHTRLPIVIPDRITDTLLDAICHPQLQTVMVVHCNHANEIDQSVRIAMSALKGRDITLLNQSVLLAGVNDDAETLIALSDKLFAAGALPYYLHLLDKVQGAAHFDVSEQRASLLMGEMACRLPGYLVPKLAREVAGAGSKIVVAASYCDTPAINHRH
ncbi:MAG: EF-P beta-lysylation protein EpmB [Halioglobus sp.]